MTEQGGRNDTRPLAAPGASAESASANTGARLHLIDAARGIAIAAMVVYHFSWDLRHFGYIAADVTHDPGWRLFARSIAGSFLFIVGVSLVLASRSGFRAGRYLRRLALIAASAAAITIVTYLVFPDSYVFFGILHHIAVASVLGLAFVNAPIWLVAAAAVASFLAPAYLAGPAFDPPAMVWLGLATYIPRSNDFVPLFPWFGVVLAGIVAARLARWLPKGLAAVAGLSPRIATPLVWAGRHSLVIYLLHQPILFGLVFLAAQVAPPDLARLEPSYVEACTSACIRSEVDAEICRRTCTCLADRLQVEGLWDAVMRQTLKREQEAHYVALSSQCRITAER